MTESSTYKNWVIFLTIIGFILRIIHLNTGIWYDEIITLVRFVRPQLLDIISSYPSENQHMFYSILAHLSVSLFGEHVWSLRIPSVLFGTLSIPALYLLGSVVASKREGLLAAALLTFSYHHIWFSQNARGYSGLLFFTLLGTYFFLQAQEKGDTQLWIKYAITGALGVYTHLTMVFVLMSHFAIFCWEFVCRYRQNQVPFANFTKPLLWGFVSLGIFSLLLYAPALLEMISHYLTQKGRIHSAWTNPLWTIAETIRGLKMGMGKMVMGLFAGGGIFALGIISYFKEHRKILALLLLPGMIALAAVLLTSHNIWPRFFFFMFGFVLLIVVRGAMVLGNLFARLAFAKTENKQQGVLFGTIMILLFIPLFILSLPRGYQPKQDFWGALRYVEANQAHYQQVLLAGLTVYPFKHYFQKPWEAVESEAQLDSLVREKKETWLLYTFPVFIQSRYPDLWDAIRHRFEVLKVFPGTVGDGDIYVCKLIRSGEGADMSSRGTSN